MDYFELLNLSKEPFSNSPDPDFFYPSREHLGCLQKLELSIRLRRGLNVVIGDIGTGKTTLCRHLIRRLGADNKLETHLVLDPEFATPLEFLFSLVDMFGLNILSQAEGSAWQIKESIKNYLFIKGVDEEKTIVLIIDEGQKIPNFCLEILRELLNYETNEYKLLQIVVFAQREFQQTLAEYPNFADRINFYHVLVPLNFRETWNLLQFRITQAKNSYKAPRLFTTFGLLAIYRATGGYPRKIIHLCHRVLVAMIVQNRTKANWALVRWCSKMLFPQKPFPMRWRLAPIVAGLLVALIVVGFASRQLEMAFQEAPLSSPSVEPRNTLISSSEEPTSDRPAQEVLSDGDARAMSEATATESPPQPVETVPETRRDAIAAESSAPDVYGPITLKSGDYLEQMIRRVYGFRDARYLKAVMQINPEVTDLNTLEVGRSINFPTLPVKADPLLKNGPWVQVAEKDSLDDAYQFLRAYPPGAPPIFLLPHGNPRDGLRFSILLRDCCVDQQSAESALRRLPLSLASDARILSKWDEDLVFFVK